MTRTKQGIPAARILANGFHQTRVLVLSPAAQKVLAEKEAAVKEQEQEQER